ncbi:MAG: hypothetical protein FD160_3770 [Caulobacteraceae bacterium]|nr:MAG: hypothetical protein FD160_3770 [Caulobacteraceae bacterium]
MIRQNLTPKMVRTLRAISLGEATTRPALSGIHDTTEASTSTHVRGLLRRGLIEETRRASQTVAAQLSLTAAGHRALDEACK